MEKRTLKSIQAVFADIWRRVGRPQTGIVVDDSPLAVFTGERDENDDPVVDAYVVQPKKQKGWTPVIGDEVMLMRVQNALWVFPVEDS